MASPHSEKDSPKKSIGELLKAADRYIKEADWNKALAEVTKALAVEPNNMYAMAYKDRINVSITEEKKKAEEEKVKQLVDTQKANEKAEELPKEKTSEPIKSAVEPESVKKAEQTAVEEIAPKKLAKNEEKTQPKEEATTKIKDDAAVRLEALRQEFAATQAKLQRDVAQLTMQAKETQALKEAAEKNLSAQITALQQELAAAKQQAGKSGEKELEALKAKYQKDIERAKEIASAESLAQIATLQKEIESIKKSASGESLQKQGEEILRSMFQKAWLDGVITSDERILLEVLKSLINISNEKFLEIEAATKSDAYFHALRRVWEDGVVRPEESDYLETLREKLGISAEDHFKMENQIRKESKI
ncbi:MAG: hypothetical protein PHP42_04730 [Bacteroidota bacterium]|nr:hypothetical protein [Bacteroidota bacterium]